MIGFYSAGAMNAEPAPVVSNTGLASFNASDGEVQNFTERFGWEFTPTEDLTIIGLRVICPSIPPGGDGESLMLHRKSDGILIASAVSVPTAPMTWKVESVTPTEILSGVAYVVSSQRPSQSGRLVYRNNSFTYSDKISASPFGSLFGYGPTIPPDASGQRYRFVDIVFAS